MGPRAAVTIHSAARRERGYAEPLAANLRRLGREVWLYEASWADLGAPATHGDPATFGRMRREFFRELGVHPLALRWLEPEGSDPAASPGAAFDPILLYGFIEEIRRQVQDRLRDQLAAAGADGFPSVTLVAHSMGSVVAFDLLQSLPPAAAELPRIELLVTLGSPLWMPVFEGRHRQRPAAAKAWLNLYHPQDFIGGPLLRAFGEGGRCPPFDLAVADETPGAPHSHYWNSPAVARALDEAWNALTRPH